MVNSFRIKGLIKYITLNQTKNKDDWYAFQISFQNERKKWLRYRVVAFEENVINSLRDIKEDDLEVIVTGELDNYNKEENGKTITQITLLAKSIEIINKPKEKVKFIPKEEVTELYWGD